VELSRLPQWLQSRATALGIELDPEAQQFIIDRTEGNMLAAQQELEKLKMLAPQGPVNLATVQASTGESARYDIYQLGDAALAGDVPRALRILAGLRAEGMEHPLVLWSLAQQVHAAWGTTQHQGYNARSWQRPSPALETARRRAPRLPYARLAARLSRADRMLKGQLSGDGWSEMALLIVELAGRRALPLISTRVA
jgi:DNA polymerase-3 subunit delta